MSAQADIKKIKETSAQLLCTDFICVAEAGILIVRTL